MALRVRFLPALVLLAGLAPAPARAAAAPALPDTGLFAPVAARTRARLARLSARGEGAVTPGRIRLLLATGQTDEAARLLPKLAGDSREMAVASARVHLARLDFPSLAPEMERIAAERAATESERALRFAYLFALDDAPRVDSLTRGVFGRGDDSGRVPEILAAARLAYDRLDYPRAESLFTRALAASPPPADLPAIGSEPLARRCLALTGLALVKQKRRDWDGSLVLLEDALACDALVEPLMALTETLIRLGRTDEAISAAEWAVRLAPYSDAAHYMLGNGYARKNYTQLVAAYRSAFADPAGRGQIAAADKKLDNGDRAGAHAAYAAIVSAHPAWVDARVRLASLDFEDGRYEPSRDGCFAALRTCPEYGRAHAVLAKALEAQRFVVDVHRAGYEARFDAAPTPQVPGIEKFVLNWKSLSPRHQKRVALSVAPWKAFVPVLVEGGASYFIKPLYMQLSECPSLESLRDQRIDTDSRLWDDVRGCGGYHTVTGIEDVERTIFDRYNTVLHELTHQVHGVLPADDSRRIQDLYARAKGRDESNHDAFLSRYAGGTVFEYFAEGANALQSPMRDRYDPREVVRERLDRMDPDLKSLVQSLMARTDVSASYPVAYSSGGDDRAYNGQVSEAVTLYRKALAIEPSNEPALVSLANTLVLANRASEADSVAARAVASHGSSGPARVAEAEAKWCAGRGLDAARKSIGDARAAVRAEDRYLLDQEAIKLAWTAGDAAGALAAADSLLAYQSDHPDGLRGRAAALALSGRAPEAFVLYDQAVRLRTGVVDLRCEYARDLLGAGRVDDAKKQLAEAKLLDVENPTAEALRAWADLAGGDLVAARAHAKQAMAWGDWCDLARIVGGAIEKKAGRDADAAILWGPVEKRIASNAPPAYVYRKKIATWEQVHRLPAVERALLASFAKAPAAGARTASDGR